VAQQRRRRRRREWWRFEEEEDKRRRRRRRRKKRRRRRKRRRRKWDRESRHASDHFGHYIGVGYTEGHLQGLGCDMGHKRIFCHGRTRHNQYNL
jgi:hypothetical protein